MIIFQLFVTVFIKSLKYLIVIKRPNNRSFNFRQALISFYYCNLFLLFILLTCYFRNLNRFAIVTTTALISCFFCKKSNIQNYLSHYMMDMSDSFINLIALNLILNTYLYLFINVNVFKIPFKPIKS